MAFIPDDAVLASGDISATAFRLYAYYCMRRNRKSQGFTCPKAMALSDMRDISEPTYFRAKDQLISAGWIATNGNFITPLKGFDTLKNESFESDKTIKNESVTIKNDSPTLKNDSERYIYIPATKPATLPEDEVFLFWVSTMKKKQTAIFGKKRKNAVRERLKEGYTVEELKTAILGNSVSRFHQGDNKHDKAYNDLELICRNEVNVDSFIDNWKKHEATAQVSPQPVTRCDACRFNNGFIFDEGQPVKCSHGQVLAFRVA